MSALPPKADMRECDCPLCAKSRHSGCLWILLLMGKSAQVGGASPVKLPRREFLYLAASAAALPAAPRIARAQTYPSRSVRVIVPAPAGGGTDIVARLIGQWLSERLGQQFVIDNRPGSGGNIGTEAVVRAPAEATRSSWSLRLTRSILRCTKSSASISSATPRRSRALLARQRSCW